MKSTGLIGVVAGLLAIALVLPAGTVAGKDPKLDESLVSPPNDFNWAAPKAIAGEVGLVCAVVNAGSKAMLIRVEAKNIDGDTLTGDTKMVEPGATAAIFQGSEGGSAAPRYCKFLAENVKSLRASACVFDQGIGCVATVAAW